ncbi:glutathione S-transferase family protein [Ruixingdingia sedimenti]|uniref:Glutathione S-transferase family protein n=1 Tax=Ruixingdingia sedimenti TaxID=3073604 RepID=A0ABU1F689_9RHOB|nr:glutathione S-transferase family protein [Xinfangfangia sp. LG-4]MDR5652391.1 glutathione S-transferase family protein [Xinfangfangia sp. LG-4]
MYKVIGPKNTRTGRVLWMLEELGQPYEHDPAEVWSDTVRAFNPSGKVPVLLAEGEPIIDSVAIMQFLADRHGALTHPAGTIARARQDSLTHFLLDEIDGVLWVAARHSFILPEERRVAAVKDTLKWEFARNCRTLVARMGEGPFLMGDMMTVPDVLLGHCLVWAGVARFEIGEPRLAAFRDMMVARPAFRRAMGR